MDSKIEILTQILYPILKYFIWFLLWFLKKIVLKLKDLLQLFFKYSKSVYVSFVFFKHQQALSNKKVKRKPFTEDQIFILRQWIEENKEKPIADQEMLNILAEKTNLTTEQINNWLKNTRFALKQKGTIRDIKLIENRKTLKEFFLKKNQNPCMKDIKDLSEFTGQSEESIKAWFSKQRYEQNKRIKTNF